MQIKPLDQELLFENVLKHLSRFGPIKAQQVCEALKISQPTFSRLISEKSSILRISRGPQTLYATYRLGAWGKEEVPIYIIDKKGSLSHPVATLHPLAPKGFYLESHSEIFTSKIYEHLPYFFEDVRPSGFLGRLEPKLYPEHHFPSDINLWTEDHALTYLARCAWDLIGNCVIGENSYNLYLEHRFQRTDVCDEKARSSRYPEIAKQVLNYGVPGSSAAGEHPKFLSIRKTKKKKLLPVLVKFSPPVKDSVSQRVVDLLVCEHIAHEVLKKCGKKVSCSSLLRGNDGRVFLEIERFDRNALGGRYGVISLRALDLEFVGQLSSWSETAEALHQQKKISKATLQDILWMEVFGKLIANTDRHHGNLSFFCEGEHVKELAPVYDMLPMLYAPQQNQIVEREFTPEPPKSSEITVWKDALSVAISFWKKVQAHSDISKEFKKVTTYNEEKIRALQL
ncbi:MAG: hypothetical protein COX62_02820 [Deltaproteobacteria bacterium CG_4_10_14_0_2_um_filter_43_8]|nr:MAG: hypothetical protein COV43_02735 [Deltaproteobacteria bacterium CG11_big_fil_rev_8_21_14_0_20_42_23]PJA21288.1 MAG: hypothetical protein COX62_02820 [Deltaproteobacteria bacterium CG_4_10_14_0_2_um_filter_43_8]PJC63827.1 MAG: hypothetical protein CO021_07445 [Deltaproteobacteria bacterium CG_4_9_14_0_2_um_filter_42_21]